MNSAKLGLQTGRGPAFHCKTLVETKHNRAYGLEDWTFASDGRMEKRMSSINDMAIPENERWFIDGVNIDSVEITSKHL